MKKLIILSLIITSLFIISCKGSGGSDSSSSGGSGTTTPAATPLQGTWIEDTNDEIFVFNGNAFSQTSILSASPVMSVTSAGTFRLDNGNIYFTITNVTGINDTTTYANKDEVEAGFGITFPFAVGTEFLWGTYAVNGNTLTITQAGSSPDTYTKQ